MADDDRADATIGAQAASGTVRFASIDGGRKTKAAALFPNRKYREEDFLVGARDEKGSSVPASFRWSPDWARQAEVIIARQCFPLKTVSDLLRLGAVLVIKDLERLEPMTNSYTKRSEAIDRMVLEEERQIAFGEAFDRVQVLISKLHALPGGRRRAAEFLTGLWNQIKAMDDGYYKSLYKRRFMDRFAAELVSLAKSTTSLIPSSVHNAGATEASDEFERIMHEAEVDSALDEAKGEP